MLIKKKKADGELLNPKRPLQIAVLSTIITFFPPNHAALYAMMGIKLSKGCLRLLENVVVPFHHRITSCYTNDGSTKVH